MPGQAEAGAEGIDAVEWCARTAELGAGEILLNSMDADGTKDGFDLELIREVRQEVHIPIIASGGAGALEHFAPAVHAGADAVLLDNMSPEEAKDAVELVDDWVATKGGTRPLLECSGGITVETAGAYSAAGVDLLSSSQITQSAPALDIGLDVRS